MGLFDRFKGDKKNAKSNPAGKWAERIEKRAQNYDRQEAIQALADMATPEAVEALLKRFTFHMDPSITDQEEKESAFRGILRAGKDAIEPVRAFAAKARTGATAARPALRMPRKAASFSSWSVIDGSMWNVKRLRSTSTASDVPISDRALMASCRS